MKKLNNLISGGSVAMSKLHLRMKISVLLILTTFFQLQANSGYAQKTKISLNMSNASILEVMNEIESISEFKFFYSENELNLNKKVNIKAKKQLIENVLRTLFSDGTAFYKIVNKQIVLTPITSSVSYKSKPPALFSSQDQIKVTGQITDTNGVPLGGANIIEKGTTNGTQADFDGNFTIEVPNDAILVVSYIGFASKEVELNGQTNINISLVESAAGLDEVVVIGYGTQKKSDITGSVASIGSELNEVPTTSFDQGLQGRAAGVFVSANSGSPGAAPVIRIRGTNSLAGGTDPLYVIDGVPIYPANDEINGGGNGVDQLSPSATNVLSTINPQDIESIQVLKDASATAIYGARAANGVIIVTTKRGSNNKPKLSVDYFTGISIVNQQYDLLNAAEFAQIKNTFDVEVSNASPTFTEGEIVAFEQNGGTDWQDKAYRTAIRQNMNIGVSGGSEKSRYYLSTNYYSEEGVIIGSELERLSIRANLDFDITDRFRVGNSFTASFTSNNAVPFGADRGPITGTGVASQILRFEPTTPVFNDDGTYVLESVFAGGTVGNPVAQALTQELRYRSLRTLGNFYIEYDILEDLTAKVSLGYDVLSRADQSYSPMATTILGRDNDGVARRANVLDLNWVTDYTLTYQKITDNHSLTVLGGVSVQANELSRTSAARSGFISDALGSDNLEGGAVEFQGQVASSNVIESSLLSYLGRVNYSFRDKYLLTLSGRYDGSSRFAEGNEYGFFPSAAIGWRINNEPFLEDVEEINNLKLRVSYGVTGNNAGFTYRSLATFGTFTQEFDDLSLVSVRPTNLANQDLSWEETTQLNIGLDAGFFNGKLDLTLDYYKKDTEDLLVLFDLPSELGISSVLLNSGDLTNEGFEITAGSRWQLGDFSFDVDTNLAFNTNTITRLRGDGEDIVTANLFLNEAIGSFYGYTFTGISDMGTVEYEDIDGDGVVNSDTDDRTILGQQTPKFTYGINTNISYKNFDLSLFLQGAGGHQIHNAYLQSNQEFNGINNAHGQVQNYWTPTNTDTNLPALGARDFLSDFRNGISSLYLEDGDYLRLKNVTLGYNFPRAIYGPGARIYITGTNLLTFTQYKGQDPEIIGADTGRNYPFIKTGLLGLNINF